MKISVLDWDSGFLKKPVAKIEIDNNEQVEFNSVLQLCKSRKFKLVYIFLNSSNKNLVKSFKKQLGEPVNIKQVYQSESLKKNSIEKIGYVAIKINKKNVTGEIEKQLLQMAIKAGKFSRFKLDKKIGDKKFVELYKTWISTIVKDKNCSIIVSYEKSNELAGFLAYKKKHAEIKIEFISVKEAFKKKGIGKGLINTLLNEADSKKIKLVKVETQAENTAACKFYKSCGFSLSESYHVFHLHL